MTGSSPVAFYLAGIGLALVLSAASYVVTDWCTKGRRVLAAATDSRPVEPA